MLGKADRDSKLHVPSNATKEALLAIMAEEASVFLCQPILNWRV